MFRSSLVLVGCLLAACEKPLEAHLRQGEAAARRHDWQAAREAFEAATQDDPQSAAAEARLGSALFELRQWEAAQAAWAKARALDPKDLLAAEGLAQLALEAHDAGAALATLEGSGSSLLEARALLARGAPGDAAAALELAQTHLGVHADEAAALYLAGSAQIALQRYADAQATLDRLQRAWPKSPSGSYGLARLAAAQQRSTDVLLNLRAARDASGPAWDAAAVAADPAFAFVADRPDFKELVGN